MDRNAEDQILEELHRATRNYPKPISWCEDLYDATTVDRNASCFFIEIGRNRFGVTANHVFEAFKLRKREYGNLNFIIGEVVIPNIVYRIIDADPTLDVATFTVTDREFSKIGAVPVSCPVSDWPPRPPEVGRGVAMVGYPEDGTIKNNPNEINFEQVSNILVASGVDEQSIIVEISRDNLRQLGFSPVPSITRNLSGLSGSPLLTVSSELHRIYRLGGIVIQQFDAKNEDDFAVVIARRCDCLAPDGTLIRKSIS